MGTQTTGPPIDLIEDTDNDTEEISMAGSAGVDIAELLNQSDDEHVELNGIDVIVLSSELESTSYVDVVGTTLQDNSNDTLVDIVDVTLTPDNDDEHHDEPLDSTIALGLDCHVELNDDNNCIPDVASYRSMLSSSSSSSGSSSFTD
jgi:hypothetical protein